MIFAEAMAAGQIYRASPMSLLYAIAPLYRAVGESRIVGTRREDLIVIQPSSLAEIVRAVETERPDMLGFSVTTASAAFARDAARLCKQRLPDVQIVVGGPHFDGLAAHYAGRTRLLDPYVDDSFDVVVVGQAEHGLAQLVGLAAESPDKSLSEVVEANLTELRAAPGKFAVWWRSAGELRILPAEGTIPSALERRTRPPRELIPSECEHHFSIFRDAEGRTLRTAQVLSYRGCLFAANPRNACSFCFVGNSYAPGDLDGTLDELRHLRAAGYRAIFFDDAVFTSRSRARKAQLTAIAEVLKELRFDAVGFQTRADYVDREVLAILGRVDSRWYCSLGLESTDETILELVGKKQSIEAVRDALSLLRESQFDVGLYLLFGAVGDAADGCRTPETVETARRTIDFVAGQRDESVPIVCVLPGVSMILPGTRDAQRYEASAAQAATALRFDVCHLGDPWCRFEGGLGMHAPGVTGELLEEIQSYGRCRLGSAWLG